MAEEPIVRPMALIDLGPLRVSRLCLGTMLMGGRTPPDEAQRILDAFVAAGGAFVDTADTYEDGGSERTLAPWLARRRDEVVVATKVRFDVSDPGGSGLAPERIAKACDASLRRLGVDVIDLYQLHAPDTRVPLEDTLGALDALVRAGKVRALGASNFPAWLLAWAVAVQDREGFAPFVSLQPQYSLVERSIEIELLPFCRAAGLGVLPWGPLGAGAAELGATVPQVALAWLLAQPGVTAPIIGPRTFEQLEDLLPAAELELTAEQVERLGRWTAPPPGYPQRMLAEQSGIDVATIRLRRASA